MKSDEIFYRYHGLDNRTKYKVVYTTKTKYASEAELRKKLALSRDWPVKLTSVSTIKVPTGIWVNEGKVASQGPDYPGGDYQAVITNVPRSWILNTKKAF